MSAAVDNPLVIHGPGWYTRRGRITGSRYLFLVDTSVHGAGQVSMGRAGYFWLPRVNDDQKHPRVELTDNLGPGWIGHVRGLIRIHRHERAEAEWKRRGRKAGRAARFAEHRGRAS